MCLKGARKAEEILFTLVTVFVGWGFFSKTTANQGKMLLFNHHRVWKQWNKELELFFIFEEFLLFL